MRRYPDTPKKPEEYFLHGECIVDDYMWLENAGSEETLGWVEAQNRFTEQYFQGNLREEFQRTRKFLKEKPVTASLANITHAADKIYAVRYSSTGDYAIVQTDRCFQKQEEIPLSFLDEYHFIPDGIKVNPENEAVAIITGMVPGESKPGICIVDLGRQTLIRKIDNIFFAYWFHDGKTILLSESVVDRGANRTKNTLKRYSLVEDSFTELYAHKDNSLFIPCRITEDDRYIFFTVAINYSRTQVFCLDTVTQNVEDISGEPAGLNFYIGNIGGRHYLQSDCEYKNGAIYSFELTDGKVRQRKLIITDPDRIMDSLFVGTAAIVSNRIVVTYLDNAVNKIYVYSEEGCFERELLFDERYCTIKLVGKSDIPGDECCYFSAESFTSPQKIYRYLPKEGRVQLCWSALERDGSAYETEQVFVPARDGTRLAAFVVRRRDTKLDGSAPALIFGYGGYGLSVFPHFKNGVVGLEVPDWLDMGGIYVSVTIRGGGEYGSAWHNDGKLRRKKNAFQDFIDITQWLIDNGYIDKDRIAIAGCSNGGLLMSALTTMRPDMFAAVIDSVPHTDLLRFINDPTGPMYKTEYGDVSDPEDFQYLKSYSPYHAVKRTRYPAVFVQTGEKDNNVPPYHGKKFAAKLQECQTGEAPILLKVLKNGGHNRGTGEDRYDTFAQFIVFIREQLRMVEEV